MGSARKILQGGNRQQQPPPPIPAEGKRKREGTKRITVDLPRDEHKFLRDYAYDQDTDGMRVVRALLMELRDDEKLSARVLQRLPDTDRRRSI